MKKIKVNTIDLPTVNLDYLKTAFIRQNWHDINQSPWADIFPYKPIVKFQIAYDKSHIYLHYHVLEDEIKAVYSKANENVWEDSCVEFFISLDDKKSYYNFEFNVLGTGLIGYGPAVKSERKRFSEKQIETVQTYTQISKVDNIKQWEIYLIVPLDLLEVDHLNGKTLHANFYKCGDKLSKPHFLTWNLIEFHKPNFHLPEFFGELNFA